MKTLFLCRHAKAEKQASTGADHDRRLNQDGVEGAQDLAEQLIRAGLKPQHIIASDSMRTAQTAQIIVATLGLNAQVRFDPSLYEGSEQNYLSVLAALDDEDAVMLVGHNPSIEDLIAWFEHTHSHIRPGTCAVFTLDITDWTQILAAPHPVTSHHFVPRNLKD